MKASDVARLRLRNQRLLGPPLATPAAVVGWLGAVQSQDFQVAKWSVGQRARGATQAQLARAYADGTILRTHVLRPTWHFVLPADLRWLMELSAPRVHALSAYYYRQVGLDQKVFARSHALIAKELASGRHLTRDELGAALSARGIAAEGLRLVYLLIRAELDLVVCSGAPRGKQHTYALVAERAPGARSLPRDEALAELARRYFTSHGPATVKDFAWWSSLTVTEARRGLAAIEKELQHAEVEGCTFWFAEPPTVRGPRGRRVHLLQAYDEYLVAYSESKVIFNVAGLPHGRVPSAGPFNSAVVLDGQVVGRWRRLPDARAAAIEVAPARPLTAAERRALDEELQRYGHFMRLPARLGARAPRARALATPP
jgi:hypothetical protein